MTTNKDTNKQPQRDRKETKRYKMITKRQKTNNYKKILLINKKPHQRDKKLLQRDM